MLEQRACAASVKTGSKVRLPLEYMYCGIAQDSLGSVLKSELYIFALSARSTFSDFALAETLETAVRVSNAYIRVVEILHPHVARGHW